MAKLFNSIYHTQKIPEQRKVSKIIPIFKKGNKNEIENYRPIAHVKGHKLKLYESLRAIAGPFFEFTTVKLKGPNKQLNIKNITSNHWKAVHRITRCQ